MGSGVDENTVIAGLETAWEMGACMYDTANVYGHGTSERRLGRLGAQIPREQITLASKVGYFASTAAHGFDPAHMRHRLEQPPPQPRHHYLDICALHHPDFSENDRWLADALHAMRSFKEKGPIRTVGTRGLHRLALDCLHTRPGWQGGKITRFRALFDTIQPDVLAVRDNLLTPPALGRHLRFRRRHHTGVHINKPVARACSPAL